MQQKSNIEKNMKVIELFNKIYSKEVKAGTRFIHDGNEIVFNGVDFHLWENGEWYCLDAEDLDSDIEIEDYDE